MAIDFIFQSIPLLSFERRKTRGRHINDFNVIWIIYIFLIDNWTGCLHFNRLMLDDIFKGVPSLFVLKDKIF